MSLTTRTSHFLRAVALAFGIVLMAGPVLAQTGREIMEEQDRRHSSDSEVVLSQMVIDDGRGNTRERRLVVLSTGGEAGRSLTKFLEPRDIRNVSLLTWEKIGGEEDDQWLYLEASRQTKRIVGGAKKSAFMGTDFAFEDLRNEDLEAHDYEVVGEEEVDGQLTWMVKATPATEEERRNSGYAERIHWVRQDNYMTVQTSYRDRRGRELKRAVNSDLVLIEGEMWRANATVMETIREGTKTSVTVDTRELGADLDETVFAPQNIAARVRYR